MKLRTSATLLILLAAAGAVFYFGWVQILLPQDSYAVGFTKTGGWDTQTMEAGTFVWRWERLIPTNMTLHVFHLEPRATTIRHSAELPSGALYARFLNNAVSFTYELDLQLRYILNPAELPSVVAEQGLRSDQVEEFYSTLESVLQQEVIERIPTLMTTVVEDPTVTEPLSTLQQALREGLEAAHPGIRFLALNLTKLSLPDLPLYRTVRAAYGEVQDLLNEARGEAQAAALRREIAERSRLEMLAQYGRVLEEYPQLLDYFRLQADTGADPLNLGSLQVTADR